MPVHDLLEVDQVRIRPVVGIMVPVLGAMADTKAKTGVVVVADAAVDENLFETLNQVPFVVVVTGDQTILPMAGIFSLVENHPKHIPIVLEVLQHQARPEAVLQSITKIPLITVLKQNHGQKHP